MKKVLLIALFIAVCFMTIPALCVILKGDFYKAHDSGTVNVFIVDENRIEKMDTGQYLKEVVASEMPAEFSVEALKAQSVAARTYMQRKINSSEKDEEHKGADVCTDFHHCKAWMREEERKKLWEEDKREEYWNRISAAVDETKGEIMYYEGEPISAVFHSTSSGKTENAKDVWGKDVPYLQSVVSEGDEYSPRFKSEYSCDINEFRSKIAEAVPEYNTESEIFSDIKRSEAGGIISLKVYGVEIKGSEFRNIFNLRSSNVELEREGDIINMKISGNGHGVGMSQYGAEYLGKNGAGYKEILTKYYKGVEIRKIN